MKLTDLKEGDVILLDDGFGCLNAGPHRVEKDPSTGGLFVWCSGLAFKTPRSTQHFLDGQEDEHGELIGVLEVVK